MEVIEIAKRIIDIDPYEARHTGATPESIAEQIESDPNAVISYLLDIIDEITA